jgi:uncharacterized Ntn-hydrolase superfamily protein
MTFSLIGRCARTGALGIASTTGGIAVGARVGFIAHGVGAVLTQHRTDPRLGPRMLALLADGASAAQAVAGAVASIAPEHAAWRQMGAMHARGETAFFHGASVKPARGARQGEGCLALGNVLADEAVLDAMVAGFAADGPLAERLLAGLDAGLAAGGEGAPLVSACLKVAAEPGFCRIDLRIDRDAAPLAALRLLYAAYAPHAEEYARRALDPTLASGAAAEAAMKAALEGGTSPSPCPSPEGEGTPPGEGCRTVPSPSGRRTG